MYFILIFASGIIFIVSPMMHQTIEKKGILHLILSVIIGIILILKSSKRVVNNFNRFNYNNHIKYSNAYSLSKFNRSSIIKSGQAGFMLFATLSTVIQLLIITLTTDGFENTLFINIYHFPFIILIHMPFDFLISTSNDSIILMIFSRATADGLLGFIIGLLVSLISSEKYKIVITRIVYLTLFGLIWIAYFTILNFKNWWGC